MRNTEIEQGVGSVILWHRTSEAGASAILASGFVDASTFIGGIELQGVWLSNWPLDAGQGAKGPALLRVTVAATVADLEPFEVVDESGDATYREWCVPAAWLATRATLELTDDDDPRILEVEWPRWDEEA